MSQPNLFDGATIEPGLDNDRLTTQIERVYALMRDGQWRLLNEIAEAVEGSEAGVSARLRDLRKPWWGEHTLLRQRLGTRWLYQLQISEHGLLDGHRNSNPKAEARERITAFLDAYPNDFPISYGSDGSPLWAKDLRVMLR